MLLRKLSGIFFSGLVVAAGIPVEFAHAVSFVQANGSVSGVDVTYTGDGSVEVGGSSTNASAYYATPDGADGSNSDSDAGDGTQHVTSSAFLAVDAFAIVGGTTNDGLNDLAGGTATTSATAVAGVELAIPTQLSQGAADFARRFSFLATTPGLLTITLSFDLAVFGSVDDIEESWAGESQAMVFLSSGSGGAGFAPLAGVGDSEVVALSGDFATGDLSDSNTGSLSVSMDTAPFFLGLPGEVQTFSVVISGYSTAFASDTAPFTPVPEPTSIALLALGAGVVASQRRRAGKRTF